ncbi:hypothetical protein HA402_014238 [Bradysia odoriphaga]|nr:hypothetical protein HA402_014238 [Bradysia odoriphaga]
MWKPGKCSSSIMEKKCSDDAKERLFRTEAQQGSKSKSGPHRQYGPGNGSLQIGSEMTFVLPTPIIDSVRAQLEARNGKCSSSIMEKKCSDDAKERLFRTEAQQGSKSKSGPHRQYGPGNGSLQIGSEMTFVLPTPIIDSVRAQLEARNGWHRTNANTN